MWVSNDSLGKRKVWSYITAVWGTATAAQKLCIQELNFNPTGWVKNRTWPWGQRRLIVFKPFYPAQTESQEGFIHPSSSHCSHQSYWRAKCAVWITGTEHQKNKQQKNKKLNINKLRWKIFSFLTTKQGFKMKRQQMERQSLTVPTD